jgi:hypothetical protein
MSIITDDGRLVNTREKIENGWKGYKANFHGILHIYTSLPPQYVQENVLETECVEFILKFHEGQFVSLKTVTQENDYDDVNIDMSNIVEISDSRHNNAHEAELRDARQFQLGCMS